jgi:hypothetical protein
MIGKVDLSQVTVQLCGGRDDELVASCTRIVKEQATSNRAHYESIIAVASHDEHHDHPKDTPSLTPAAYDDFLVLWVEGAQFVRFSA